MPTYEYHCAKCGNDFERIEPIAKHDEARVRCPKCRASDVERVFTPFYAKTVRKS